MEDREFEELAKAIASGQSRRRIVKAIAGSALAGAAGLFARGRTTAAATTTTKRPTTTRPPTTTKRPTTTQPPTTTKRPTTTQPPTTTKRPTTTTKRPDNNQVCYHSEGPNGGCKGACTSAGFTGRECNPICGNGQFRGLCPVGQGGGNPCCNAGLCEPSNFRRVNGQVTYVGPTAGCPGGARERRR